MNLNIHFLGAVGLGVLFPAGPPGLPGTVLGLGCCTIGFLAILKFD